jgi:O-antigen ligase
MSLPESENRNCNRQMVYVLYFGAFSSGLSIAGSNAAMGFMFLFFVYDLVRERNLKGLSRDFNWITAMYGWKGVTTILNGAWGAFWEIREIWDKLPYVMIGKYRYTEKAVNTVFHTMFASNAALVVYALLQKYFNVPWFFQSLFSGDVRLIGYFGHPLHYGGFVSLVILACFGLVFFYERKYAWYLPLLITGLAMSGSRGYFIAVAVAVSALAFLKSRKVFIATMVSIPTLVIGYAALFSGFRDRLANMFSSGVVGDRMNFWSIAWETFLQNPFIGVGYEQFTYLLRPYAEQGIITNSAHAHNLYLEELAEGGIVGGAIVTGLTVYFVYKYFSAYKANEGGETLLKSLYAGLLGCFIVLAVGGIFEYHFGTAVVWIQITFLMGLAEGFRKMCSQEAS